MHRELVTKMIPPYFIKILDLFCFCLLRLLQTKGHTSLILYALMQNKSSEAVLHLLMKCVSVEVCCFSPGNVTGVLMCSYVPW